jgi:hypothetical protein
MTTGPNLTVRVWCSPRAGSTHPWKWAVANADDRTVMEFGAEATEEEAKHEAAAARPAWFCILTNSPTPD